MEQLVQCPVCTLFLHNGMSLESHLDTHPKDQVIKALCTLSANTGYGSRTSTPMHSERSYRSRSRTPATEDIGLRWSNSQRNSDHDRYWRRAPSRTSKSTCMSRMGTPMSEVRMSDLNFENNLLNNPPQCLATPYSVKSDKTQQTYSQTESVTEFDQGYIYYEQQDDREVKYSRSAEYNVVDSSSSVFAHNTPIIGSGMKLHTTLLPTVPRRGTDYVKILPKPNNLLVKTNVGGVQYITPSVKPVHVVVPSTPTFVQRNVQNNMLMTGSIPASQIIETKSIPATLSTNQYNPMSSTNTFTPVTTVVSQNSQIIYREMVHSIDGKPFISSVPTVLTTQDNVSNIAQTNSMYQNVMLVDPYGNTSCVYTTSQPILSKPCDTPIFNENIPPNTVDKSVPALSTDANKTLVIEVSPIVPPTTNTSESNSEDTTLATQGELTTPRLENSSIEENISKNSKDESTGNCKGLKILSNVKVEVPIQHHKNLINTVLDLTGPNENEYTQRPISPDQILPDLDNNQNTSDDNTQPSTASGHSLVSHTFSVIKNVGNPPLYKDSSKSNTVDSKIETEFSDSCPVPDLICNEKPSISPCSELSESCDNSTDRVPISPKPESSQSQCNEENDTVKQFPIKSFPNNPLRLNNIYLKKHKKILQIKNAKVNPSSKSLIKTDIDSIPSSSTSNLDSVPSSSTAPENYTVNKIHQTGSNEKSETSVNVVKEDDNTEFDADTEEQSMDIEPVAPSSINHSTHFSAPIVMVQVKEENNISNEAGFNSETDLMPLESIRPINVITYGNMSAGDFDEESSHRELLDLEAASKNKQFVNMMNENYFGDNIYADYFTPDRVESFDSERVSEFNRENSKDGMYIWGEPSQKEGEFVLPNFIHESYKIAESSGIEYTDMDGGQENLEGEADGCEKDNKADVLSESRSDGEPTLNICADECMPPRGELSGQESNGATESPWIYQEPPSEPYDLIARESWISDGSEMDPNEKRESLEEDHQVTKCRMYTCTHCGAKFCYLKELRTHKSLAHALPTSSGSSTTYSRLITARTIKKEEKTEVIMEGNLLAIGSKESITTSVLQVYDTVAETKPDLGIVKQEPKRKRRDFICPTCKVDQLTDAAFHAHLKIHPLECLTCGKCFFKRANLALHLKIHLGVKNYKCDLCEKRFITRQKLMEHHNIHTGRAPIKCTICDETFRRYSNMIQHRDRHHLRKKAKIRDFICHCGSIFHSRAKLRWHMEIHDERPKACPYCNDKFIHTSSLTRHVRRMHNEYYVSEKDRIKGKNDNVPCPICKQIYLRSNLRAHLEIHSGKRPFVCIICNKAFTTKWNLKLHRWTHMSRSSKPFKCNLCKGAFYRNTEYVAHMNAHKSVRPYTCNYCGCQFIRKYNCQRHVREHEMAKKYICKVPECGKTFHRSYYLSEHMKVHSGARPFTCNICGKSSSNKSNHNKHIKIHHAREPVATEA